jgi:hypothetical protein
MTLNEIYTAVLACAGMSVDSEGFISTKVGDKSLPALIDGKRMVLPTQFQLSNLKPDSAIVFHPLRENIMQGESPILNKLRKSIVVKLNYTFAIICQNLLDIIASTAVHHTLTPDQSMVLSIVTDVDKKTLEVFNKIQEYSCKDNFANPFVKIFLKKGGKVDDKTYSRAGIVSFPILEQLTDKAIEAPCGISMRVKDREGLIKLYNFIFTASNYSVGSNTQVAPYVDALMNATAGPAGRLNDLLILYSNLIEDSDKLIFNSDWVDAFVNINDFIPEIRKIPMQLGNGGNDHTLVQPVPQSQVPFNPNPTQFQPVVNPYVQQPIQPQPVTPVPGKGMDFDTFLRSNPALQQAIQGSRPNPMMSQPIQQGRDMSHWNGTSFAHVNPQMNHNQYNPMSQPFNPYAQPLYR